MDTYDIDKKHKNMMDLYDRKINTFIVNKNKYIQTKKRIEDKTVKYENIKTDLTDPVELMRNSLRIISCKKKLKNLNTMFEFNDKKSLKTRDRYIKLVYPFLSTYYMNSNNNKKIDAVKKYILKVDPTLYTSIKQQRILYCDICQSKNLKFIETGQYFCDSCGNINNQFLDETSFDNSYDSKYSRSSPSYSRKSFFIIHLSRLFCITQKNKKHMSSKLIERLIKEMENDDIYHRDKISSDLVIKYLKKMYLNDYTYDVPYIISKIKNENPPVISAIDFDKLIKWFQEFELVWPYIKNESQKSINYQYILRKLLELIENYDEYLDRIKISKTQSNIQKLDKIWKKGCEFLKWQYIPTYAL